MRIVETGYQKEKTEFFGSKFCIGNGYYGYRGTLEEYTKDQLVACTLSEIFDDSGNGWREPVNVPNGLKCTLLCDGEELSVLTKEPVEHEQALDLKGGFHERRSVFVSKSGKRIEIKTERFASLKDLHLLVMKYAVIVDEKAELVWKSHFDCDIWDINGPHFYEQKQGEIHGIDVVASTTIQNKKKAAVGQFAVIREGEGKLLRENGEITVTSVLEKGKTLEIVKYVSVCKETDCVLPEVAAADICLDASEKGYQYWREEQEKLWKERYEHLGIEIIGDEEAQLAVYYSCYLLLCSAPFHTDTVAIPARGLSGQVYKGAMFWDTEIYMLPMFAFCEPEVARNLMNYRVKNLAGALKKAAEYDYQGAFFPWESQENGEDGCTHYNLTDIFTGRKMRTYFRDKQIHISADVVYGLWKYMMITGDYSLLFEGGAETILECARFFYSYSYYKKGKHRYEFLDVTGADEYHERINNDAYTNYMIDLSLKTALHVIEYLKKENPAYFEELLKKIEFPDAEQIIGEMAVELYLPQPNADGVIEQFDGYFKEEDLTIEELYSRIIKPNEYLGSPTGLAVHTQILKQADVVLLLSLLGDQFSSEIKEKNWKYYEPRTEHGSSLSTCIYALLAAQIGMTDWAYKYLMRAGRIDLDGDYKLYLGDLYIGGTHPAANGGTWMVTVQGFGGLTPLEEGVSIIPHLPEKWTQLSYCFYYGTGRYRVSITSEKITLEPLEGEHILKVTTETGTYTCKPTEKLEILRGDTK